MPAFPARRAARILVPVVLLAGCAATQRFLQEAFRERPPRAIAQLDVASDARVDSLGRIAGSFVGEGTSRAVHLLSSDTQFVAELIRRYAPDIRRTTNFWDGVTRRGIIRIPLRDLRDDASRGVLAQPARVGSPAGRTDVLVTAITIHAGRCGALGTQAELVVEPLDRDGPELTGPVVGSVDPSLRRSSPLWREAVPAPGAALAADLVSRTRQAMDSLLLADHARLALGEPLAPPELNTLADLDAADVVGYQVSGDRVRYAVALRERRVQGRDTLVTAGVMSWDSAGTWQQTILQPTLLRLRGGLLRPYGRDRPYFWRRLDAVSDFGFQRDNLFMEQVDVRDGSVIWGVLQPADNVPVAAARMRGPCM